MVLPNRNLNLRHGGEVPMDDTGEPPFITQNGKAGNSVQDIRSYEQSQETLAILKILALGEAEVARGETVSADGAIEGIRKRLQL